jgi:peptidoglycan L-alanyl-D-glutamate endopeptidase CwlK
MREMMPSFSEKSLKALETCDERLQRLFKEVVKYWDCTVTEGKRTEEEQRHNVAVGASKTLDSKHVYPLGKPSLAADVAPYPVKWKDYPRFYAFAGFVIGTAVAMGLKVRWGGDWDSDRDFSDQNFNDLVHFELVD